MKRIFLVILVVLLGIVVIYWDQITYSVGQAKGQFHVLWNARPVSEYLNDPTLPDSIKRKLILVRKIKDFAVNDLGLKPTESYKKMYDQEGKEVLWVVSACKPYSFEPMTWTFPIIGSFTYKGFFNQEKATGLAKELSDLGMDIEMRSVNGWSTLGWFNDPILSNMLEESDGGLAETIIHEITHGTIFIPDSMTFNENLATFIGVEGAKQFLRKVERDSVKYQSYIHWKEDSRKFSTHLVRGAHGLDSLYKLMINEPKEIKEKKKKTFIQGIAASLDTLQFHDPRYKAIFSKKMPNNAYFISFLNYRERQTSFNNILNNKFHNDLYAFIAYWKEARHSSSSK